MDKNQHRWKNWVANPQICHLLEEWAETLVWAWNVDRQDPKTYPMNTGNALFQLKREIKERLGPREQGQERKRKHQKLSDLLRRTPPKRFSELIDDRTIEVVYEDQNADSYKNALRRASRGDQRTFRKLLRALGAAYDIDRIGVEVAPRPKVHLLHRDLFEAARMLGLEDLTDEGMQEFLDDLCPCGKPHNADAVRKFRKRQARSRS